LCQEKRAFQLTSAALSVQRQERDSSRCCAVLKNSVKNIVTD